MKRQVHLGQWDKTFINVYVLWSEYVLYVYVYVYLYIYFL